MYAHTARLNYPMPRREVQGVWDVWLPRVEREWAPRVRVPVMLGLAERDVYWQGTAEHVRVLAAAFAGSPRVEASVIRGAPHNLEMTYWAQGWYARCFGFGMECAASFAVDREEV